MKSLEQHCESELCRKSRPFDAGQNAAYFTRDHLGPKGGHLYLGPCACACERCRAAEASKLARLGSQ